MNGLSTAPIVDADILRIAGPVIVLLFFVAIVVAVYKIVKGPSILDRMMASDVLLATLMCGFGGYIALMGRVDLLPVLLSLACLGFLGSVSVSRYVSRSENAAPVIGSTHFEERGSAGGSGADAEESAATLLGRRAAGSVDEDVVQDEVSPGPAVSGEEISLDSGSVTSDPAAGGPAEEFGDPAEEIAQEPARPPGEAEIGTGSAEDPGPADGPADGADRVEPAPPSAAPGTRHSVGPLFREDTEGDRP